MKLSSPGIAPENKGIAPKDFNLRRFRIPLYQRPYAWESFQVETLMNDLYSAFKEKSDQPYYLGILSIATVSNEEAIEVEQGYYDLIDGQQRITTLALIARAAARNKCNEDNWKIFLANRLFLWGRREDQAFIDGIDDIAPGHKMRGAFNVIDAFFEKLSGDKGTAKEFSEFIYNYATFFLAEVPRGYSIQDKNLQFVRMNHRGKQLEKHEILKVKLIKRLDEHLRTAHFENWNKMVGCLSGNAATSDGENLISLEDILRGSDSSIANEKAANTGIGSIYSAIVSIPEFLLIALDRFVKSKENSDKSTGKKKEESEVSISHKKENLIGEFENIFGQTDVSTNDKSQKYDISDFFKVLDKQTDILKTYFIFRAKDDNKVNYVFDSAEKSDTIKENGKTNKSHLKTLQSYLYVSTVPYHWLLPAFDWCEKNSGDHFTDEAFIKELEKIDNEIIKTKRKLKLPNCKDLSYRNPSLARYWFYRLDYELWKLGNAQNPERNATNPNEKDCSCIWSNYKSRKENKEHDLLGQFRFRRCDSIEHIIPQKNKLGSGEKDKPNHSFGNLALISSSRNSKFSNYSAEAKKSFIESGTESYTESLKMLHFLYIDRTTSSDNDVTKAGELMYKVLSNALEGKAD